ncbi:MAG: hypothetical protein KDD84_06730 [Caldilineaceae bacterium]|nr:hypothetical protein [Caldilineaceae bacterium]
MSNAKAEITIRKLITVEECQHFQELQHRVWVGEPDTEIVPIHVLITQAQNGGMLLGAFAADGPESHGGMVGIAFGWPGFGQVDGAPALKFCSHMVGVLPPWHGRGVGLKLKLAQRRILLEEGQTDWVTWTYDPLQRVNAAFNLHRLGAVCSTYKRNQYGEMQDHLNAGMPSDRFQVDWYLRSRRVENAVSAQPTHQDWTTGPLAVLPVHPVSNHVIAPVQAEIEFDGRPIAVPIPDSVASVRVESGLLLEWRHYLREAAESCFAAGYQVVDCVHLPDRGWRYIFVPKE